MLISLLSATLLAGPVPPPQPARATHRYRVEVSIASTVDLTGLGGELQTQEQSTIGFVSVTIADSASGQLVRAVVDSASFRAGAEAGAADIAAAAAGLVMGAFVDPTGRVTHLAPPGENPVVAMLQAALGDFLPRRRPRVGPGERWSDTLQIHSEPGGGSLDSRVVTTFTQGGAEQFHGRPAVKLDASFATEVSGKMVIGGGDATVTGSASGAGNYYMSGDGRFLGGSRTTTQTTQITMNGAPAPIPVKSTTVTVVTPLS